jgi:hypothetical protein
MLARAGDRVKGPHYGCRAHNPAYRNQVGLRVSSPCGRRAAHATSSALRARARLRRRRGLISIRPPSDTPWCRSRFAPRCLLTKITVLSPLRVAFSNARTAVAHTPDTPPARERTVRRRRSLSLLRGADSRFPGTVCYLLAQTADGGKSISGGRQKSLTLQIKDLFRCRQKVFRLPAGSAPR